MENNKTYTAFGIWNIVNDMDIFSYVYDDKTTFLVDEHNERMADVYKLDENKYRITEWRPFRYANSIGV
jgi:hypothetical protein